MNKLLYRAAFAAGLVAIGWVGAAALRGNPVALAMTVLIGAFYVMGALELRRFDQATDALARVLDDTARAADAPASLSDWLTRVPAALRDAVRARFDGERVALPGPALTPYISGLLVLLGMLGTFLGMVVTLAGTGLAMERATDLQTMRDSLGAPVKGLGLAFGTSVAGVAASAALGLMSALSRRARLQAAQSLDGHLAGVLRPLTRAFQRDAALDLQQQQAAQIPVLVAQVQALMAQMAGQSQQLHERLLAGQERFHGEAQAAYQGLAGAVDQTLQRSLGESARIAAATIQPAVEATMAGIARETTALHGQIAASVQQQIDGLAAQLDHTAHGAAEQWAAAFSRQEQASQALATRIEAQAQQTLAAAAQQAAKHAAALQHTLDEARTHAQAEAAARDEARLAAWNASLAAMADALQREWQQAGAQTAEQQARICATLEQTAGRIAAQAEAHAHSTIGEIARLVQTASDAPRAAAEVVAQLREKLSDSMARDHAMLEERARIMETLNTLLGAVQHTSTAQKAAIDTLVASTATWLEEAGARFTEKADAESARIAEVSAQLTAGAVEVASLGEAFGAAVGQFGQANTQLMAHLQRLDETLGKAIVRSDEQLAYYVAQAREVIDLSLHAQKQIVDDLQRVAGRRATTPDPAEA